MKIFLPNFLLLTFHLSPPCNRSLKHNYREHIIYFLSTRFIFFTKNFSPLFFSQGICGSSSEMHANATMLLLKLSEREKILHTQGSFSSRACAARNFRKIFIIEIFTEFFSQNWWQKVENFTHFSLHFWLRDFLQRTRKLATMTFPLSSRHFFNHNFHTGTAKSFKSSCGTSSLPATFHTSHAPKFGEIRSLLTEILANFHIPRNATRSFHTKGSLGYAGMCEWKVENFLLPAKLFQACWKVYKKC